ncbi:hypothetical protein SAY87_005509 [Trapa incisa]|uniref:Uncharacterized protein n=1 Tax=Trapa incisa TaxID=236973 RepID=A0AAN7K602_9MYRT|nr:hypothetical protein SAY87_005509 [Trapa incisa]
MENYQMPSSRRKRIREEDVDELELQLAEVKRLRDDLLGVLDDSDPVDSVSQELYSMMRSFEDEISAPSTSPSSPAAVIDLTSDSDSGVSTSQLGYLLEASDHDLGLPAPSVGASSDAKVIELVRLPSDLYGVGEFWGLESFNDDQIQANNLYKYRDPDDEYVTFDDGLFGFSDGCCFDPSSDVSDYLWRSGTLPAQ